MKVSLVWIFGVLFAGLPRSSDPVSEGLTRMFEVIGGGGGGGGACTVCFDLKVIIILAASCTSLRL